MARLSARGGPGRISIATTAIARVVRRRARVRRAQRAGGSARDPLFIDTAAGAADERRAAPARSRQAISTRAKRVLVDLVPRSRLRARPQGQRRVRIGKGVARTPMSGARTRRSPPRSTSFKRRCRRRSRRAASRRAAGGIDVYEPLKTRARRARLPRPAAARARISSATRDVVRRAFPGGASPASSSTSFRTPIRCRRSFCSCSPPTTPPSATGGRSRPDPGQAVRRRRPEAVDLPVPARRRRRSTARCCDQLDGLRCANLSG